MDNQNPFNNPEERLEFEEKELNRYLNEVVWKVLPKQKFSGLSQIGDRYIHRLSNINKHFKGSDYYYNGKMRFIHYTNLNSFMNIINECCLRLSDFNSLDDPQEFTYAFQQFEFIKSSLPEEKLKSCFNSISMCEYDEQDFPDSFDMWRLYGKDGYGVAFILSIENNQDSWEDFCISKVYYGDDKIQAFKDLDERHKEYMLSNPSLTFSDHMFDRENIRIPFIIYTLLGFHKNSLYKLENEVRLMSIFNPFDPPIKPNPHYYSITKSYEQSNYRKLALNDNNSNNIPIIKIEKLILGYRFNNSDLEKIKSIILTASTFKISYPIHTELSELKTFFEKH